MPPWEVSYADSFEDDFLSEEDLLKVNNKMKTVSLNPYAYSQKIKGTINKDLRKIRFGDYRLFILLNPHIEIIYCLAYLPRKNCYSKKSLNKVLTIVRDISK